MSIRTRLFVFFPLIKSIVRPILEVKTKTNFYLIFLTFVEVIFTERKFSMSSCCQPNNKQCRCLQTFKVKSVKHDVPVNSNISQNSLISTCNYSSKETVVVFVLRVHRLPWRILLSWLMTGIHCFWHKLLDFNSCPLINLSEGETILALCNVL